MKSILALDLGTKTGWAIERDGKIESGTWVLATPKEIAAWGRDRKRRTDDPRIHRLCSNLDILGHFDLVIYEDVLFSTTTFAVQLWASLRASVWLCARKNIIECLPVGSLKKFATGRGSADKADMEIALKKYHPNLWTKGIGDDTVDALWLLIFAKQNLCR